ncbi:hypothetical protein Taitung234_02080 [Helicobacter pylori]
MKHQTTRYGEIPFYKIGTFGNTADAFISKKLFLEYKTKYSFPKKGDVLISASGTIGRAVIYDGKPAYFQDSNIVWIDNDETLVKNDFLFYAYSNVKWNTEHTTILRLYNDNFRNTLIPLPPLNEQSAIANILSALDRYLCTLDALILTRMLVFSLSLIKRDLKTMAKTLKPNLDKDELNTLYKANLAYTKNTHEHYFKFKKDLDYKLFNPSIMHEQGFISFVGGQGAKRLLDILYKLAFNAKSNKIALDRHYAKMFLQVVARTLRKNVNILKEQGFIEVIKGKQRYLYVYLKDYRELESYNYIGANQKNNIPSPFFLQIMRFLEKFAKEIKRVKINNKECVMHIPSQELMQRVNNVVLKFTPISNPNTTYTLSYKDLTNKDIPSNLCFYQTAIVKKNLLKALKDKECVGEPINNSPKASNYFQESA